MRHSFLLLVLFITIRGFAQVGSTKSLKLSTYADMYYSYVSLENET
jgi:hypothetical protein